MLEKLKKQELASNTKDQSKGPPRETLPTLAIGQPVLAQDMQAFKGYLCGPFVKLILYCGH